MAITTTLTLTYPVLHNGSHWLARVPEVYEGSWFRGQPVAPFISRRAVAPKFEVGASVNSPSIAYGPIVRT